MSGYLPAMDFPKEELVAVTSYGMQLGVSLVEVEDKIASQQNRDRRRESYLYLGKIQDSISSQT